MHSHDAPCPEQWNGEVDGHGFYFRERHGEWRIEVDLRPSGRAIRLTAGADNHGASRYEERELDEGAVGACGTTDIGRIRHHAPRASTLNHRHDPHPFGTPGMHPPPQRSVPDQRRARHGGPLVSGLRNPPTCSVTTCNADPT